jgi:tRNA A37 threonylcarbamoyladenosine modification protein TsaB
MPLSSILFVVDNNWLGATKNNKKMIKDCLIINCTGKDDTIALKVDNKFFLKKLQTNIIKYEALSQVVLDFTKEHNVEIEQKFSILVNSGPGSFSGIRIALAVSKGIQLVKKSNIYSYNSFIINAAPYLRNVEILTSIIKTNNFYYYSERNIGKNLKFTAPKKMDPNYLQTNNSFVVVSQELENDDIVKNIDKKKVCIAEFDLKNIDILIENNLLENKLIKPLYLS